MAYEETHRTLPCTYISERIVNIAELESRISNALAYAESIQNRHGDYYDEIIELVESLRAIADFEFSIERRLTIDRP